MCTGRRKLSHSHLTTKKVWLNIRTGFWLSETDEMMGTADITAFHPWWYLKIEVILYCCPGANQVTSEVPLPLSSAHLSLAIDGVSWDCRVGKSLKIPTSCRQWSDFNRTHPWLLNNCSVCKDLQTNRFHSSNIPLRKFGPLPKPKFPMLWFLLVLRDCGYSCHHLVTHLMIPSYIHLTFYLLYSWVLFSGSLMYSNYVCSRSTTVGKQS